MTKIYKYELHRLLLNKFFAGLLVVTMIFSYLVMDSEIVLGVANTAPFSGWSFGAFLVAVLPVLLVTLLFFITFLYSPNEKKVRAITDSSPISPKKYALIRCASIATGFVFISLAAIVVSLIFYTVLFRFTDFRGFIIPALLVLIPAMLFLLGLGFTLGKFHPALLYILIPAVLLLPLLNLPYSVDLFSASFFTDYPAALNTIEPSFSVPPSVLIGKFVYSAAGIFLILSGMMHFRKKPKEQN